jgi:heat shock protein HspQ
MDARTAKFRLGQVVKHRLYPFRGVIYDVDPQFSNSQDWWLAIPEDARPAKDQPFYHLLAENEQDCYVAYVSEQNLLLDDSGEPVGHPSAGCFFETFHDGAYTLRRSTAH